LERSDYPGETQIKWRETLKGFIARGTLSGFTSSFFYQYPGFSLGSNPGLELANAFGVFIVLTWLELANAFGVFVVLTWLKLANAFGVWPPSAYLSS